MFGLSTSHILILGLIVLLFGSRRLPELGASMGKALRAFKSATDGQLVDDIAGGTPAASSTQTAALTHQNQESERVIVEQGVSQTVTKV